MIPSLPVVGVTRNGGDVDIVKWAARVPTLRTSTVLVLVHFTGDLVNVMSSGKSMTPMITVIFQQGYHGNRPLDPMVLTGTINFSLSVTHIKSY